ncbi:Dethiobiotin synthetase [hydrothermal vent metagenome]|uniref:Dethiobiotin synthetase n=1 Tax=hydrothermal vent metagenome TaxID=652676 RepID=A0A3B0Y5S4_9ZZZZ
MCGYFVTGTDTGVGKTAVSLELMRLLQAQGHVVTAMKPVASGCRREAVGLVNDDALQLQAQASVTLPYRLVNPYAFEAAIAPQIAAAATSIDISLKVIEEAFSSLGQEADRIVVEGIGGWAVPVNASQTMADVAVALGLPVVLVVAIRLGCINHALLTAQAITASGACFVGWIANRLDPACQAQDETITALRQCLPVLCLGDLPDLAEGGWAEQLRLPDTD